MIVAHQPTIFGDAVIAAVSSKNDGNMKFGLGSSEDVLKNRQAFLEQAGISMNDTTCVSITYDTNNFTKYRIATLHRKGEGMYERDTNYADALVTTEPGHALFLPLGDCVGAVMYDTKHHVLMVSHLGRHSVEAHGAAKSIEYLAKNFNTSPADVKVWLSPGVGKATYPLNKFNSKGLHEVICEQLAGVGALPQNIESSTVDTATSSNYFSHSEFKQGNQPVDGRFAIVAMISSEWQE